MSTTNAKLQLFSDERRQIFERLNRQGPVIFAQPGSEYWDFCLWNGVKILDCGSGSGWWLREIGRLLNEKSFNGRLLGIDKAEDFPTWAREASNTGVKPEYVIGNFTDLSRYNGETFDIVHVSQAILGGRGNIHEILGKLMTLLKPSGNLIIQEISLDDYVVTPHCNAWTEMVQAMQRNWTEIYGYPQDANQFVHFLHEAGFHNVIHTKVWAHCTLTPRCEFYKLFDTFLPEEEQSKAVELIKRKELEGANASRSRSYIRAQKLG